MGKSRALIIDREGDRLVLLRFWLREAGFEIAIASSVESALLELGSCQPSVILISEEAGQLPCREFIESLSRDAAYRETPIIALVKERAAALPLLRAGATQALCLPADLGTLIPTVCRLLEYPSAAVEAARYEATSSPAFCQA